VVREDQLDTDQPKIEFRERTGTINADLTVGVDVTAAVPLRANEGICSPGVKLHGAGFIVTPLEAEQLGLGRRPGLEQHIRHYRNGRDLTGRSRGVMVIDLFGLSADEVRTQFPEVYQHILLRVKPHRDKNKRDYRRVKWWLFGENNPLLRNALVGLRRYVATGETGTHRIFQFLPECVLADNMITVFALDEAFYLGVLSSRTHTAWALEAGGWQGAGNDPRYTKTRCFDPFPFPDPPESLRAEVRALGEELDVHRKRCQAEHPELTLTGMYNVLADLRAGVRPEALDGEKRGIFEKGLVLILKELHDRLDAAVLRAYGWPEGLSKEETLARLVALNTERAAEETEGHIRWLRPDYQKPRFGTPAQKARQIEAELVAAAGGAGKPSLPSDEVGQTAAVLTALASAAGPVDARAIAAGFRQGRRVEGKVGAVLMALARMGYVASTDGGRSFNLRRAA
jgi:hypothetical protein